MIDFQGLCYHSGRHQDVQDWFDQPPCFHDPCLDVRVQAELAKDEEGSVVVLEVRDDAGVRWLHQRRRKKIQIINFGTFCFPSASGLEFATDMPMYSP